MKAANRFDLTSLALYLTFGTVLTASGHSASDITYWLLLIVFTVSDIHSGNVAYGKGLTAGGDMVKQIYGIKRNE